jgi:putative peptidoglycan lipid II flippase
MGIGVVAGGLLQLLWQVPELGRAGFSYRPILNTRHPGLRQVFRLMLPAFLGTAAVQINVIVNTNLASSITDASGHIIDGPVSWLGYAFRFMQLPLGIFGVAIASATLPSIARSAAVQRMDEFRETVARAVGMVLLLTIPSSVGLAILGESMIGAIYQWGRFRVEDTHQTAVALTCYAVGLAGYSVTKILAPAFYALNHAAIPMLISLASIAVNFATAFSLVTWAGMGHAGLALSTSVVALFGAAALFWTLRSRTGGLHGSGILGSAWKIAAASALMGGVCLASSRGIHAFAGTGKAGQLADVAISIPLGGLVFYLAAAALRVPELEAVKTACYTAFRNAPRSEAGHPPSRNR